MEMNQTSLLASRAAGGFSTTLSAQQRHLVQGTLQQYDSNNLSTEHAKKIVLLFQQQSIPPGRELAQLISLSGFDAAKLSHLAGIGQRSLGAIDALQVQTSFSKGGSLINRLEQLINYLERPDISEQQSEQAFSQVRGLFHHSKTHGLSDTQA